MRTIYKYRLELATSQVIGMPKSAQILSVDNQGGQLCFWAMVDPNDRDTKMVNFEIVGTGHSVEFAWASAVFLGTVLMDGGALVWHVFYRG